MYCITIACYRSFQPKLKTSNPTSATPFLTALARYANPLRRHNMSSTREASPSQSMAGPSTGLPQNSHATRYQTDGNTADLHPHSPTIGPPCLHAWCCRPARTGPAPAVSSGTPSTSGHRDHARQCRQLSIAGRECLVHGTGDYVGVDGRGGCCCVGACDRGRGGAVAGAIADEGCAEV